MKETNGYIVRYALKTLKISQDQLAKKLNVSKATIAQWKNDKTGIPYEQIENIVQLLGLSNDNSKGMDLWFPELVALCDGEDNLNAYQQVLQVELDNLEDECVGRITKIDFLNYFGTEYTLYPVLSSMYTHKCPIPTGKDLLHITSKDTAVNTDIPAVINLLYHYAMVQIWQAWILDNLSFEPTCYVPTDFEFLYADYAVCQRLVELNSALSKDDRESEASLAEYNVTKFIDDIVKEHHEKGYGVPYDLYELFSGSNYFLEAAALYEKPTGMDRYISWGERRILIKLWEAELARHEISGHGVSPRLPFP